MIFKTLARFLRWCAWWLDPVHLLCDPGSEERAMRRDLEELEKIDPDWDRDLRRRTVKKLLLEGKLSRTQLCLCYGQDLVLEAEKEVQDGLAKDSLPS